jgi:hypothetical protein
MVATKKRPKPDGTVKDRKRVLLASWGTRASERYTIGGQIKQRPPRPITLAPVKCLQEPPLED